MNKYEKAGIFIEEYSVSNPPEILSSKDELQSLYANFQKDFSPEKIATIPAETITNAFTQIQDRLSAIDKTYKERVSVDEKLRNAIVKGAKIIATSTLEDISDFEILQDKLVQTMGQYFQSVVVYKYYSIIFPQHLSACYQIELQFHLLYCCGIAPHDKQYVRGGQLAMIANYACMLSPIFNSIAMSYFGNIKKFCKIDITNDQFDIFPIFKENFFVSVAFKELGDLNNYTKDGQIDVELLCENLTNIYYTNSPELAEVKALEIANFWNSNKDSVFVVMNRGCVLALGDSQSTYRFGNDVYFAHIKAVKWKVIFSESTYLPSAEEGASSSCCNLHEKSNKLFLYQKYYNIFHPDTVNVAFHRIHPFNQVLYGASGTGKTYTTTEMAMSIVENRKTDNNTIRVGKELELYRQRYSKYVDKSQITFITFHAGYSYGDFMQTETGVFKRLVERANRNHNKNFVLIIDEINRVNLANVFGEAISLIDPDKRSGEMNEIFATLPSGENFSVPNNLYIIGTINSVDKSLPPIDPGIRRKFNFIEVLPNETHIKDEVLKAVFINLNDALFKIFKNGDFLIGHSYFMHKKATDLANIVNLNILPLLYDYFQGDREKVKHILEFSSSEHLKIVESRYGRVCVIFKE